MVLLWGILKLNIMEKQLVQSESLQELQEDLLKTTTREEILSITQALRKGWKK